MKRMMPAIALSLILISFTENVFAQENGKAAALAENFENGQYELSAYNTACYFALAGNKRLALAYLRKAVNDGFNQTKTIQEDGDLASLHNEPEWPSLVKIVEQNENGERNNRDLFFNQKTFWDSKFFQSPYRENISDEEKIAGLSKFWSEAKYNFINFDLVPELNIDSLYMAYIPRVTKTKSTLEYYKLLTELCAQLKDAHTNINAPAELYNDVYARPLFRTRLVEDKVVVIWSDTSLQKKGIKKCMEVMRINGLPVKEYADKYVAPYQSCSTAQDGQVRKFDYALLGGSVHEPVQLQLADEKGKLADYTVNRVTPAERSAKMAIPDAEYKLLPGNIAYLAINTFANNSGTKLFQEKYAAIKKTKALIIDLRNNGGGSTDWTILRYLIDSNMQVHKSYSRQYVPTFRAWQRPQDAWHGGVDVIGPFKGQQYTQPVIVLISAHTFSAAEDFAAAFKSLHRGRIIGEPSGGSTGQPLVFTLPGNLSARVCTKRDQYANGDDFVGKGIQPDILVSPTITDIRKGVDTQLERVLHELK